MADARLQWLLGLAGALAVARFVIVPWTAAQNEQRQQLEVLTQRLDRSAGVARAGGEILQARESLTALTEASRKAFPVTAEAAQFRLEAQRQIAEIAARGNVKLTLFDWLMDGRAEEAGLAYGRVSARLDGPLDSLVAVHGALEGQMHHAVVHEAKVDLGRGGVAALGPTPASMTLLMDLYYRAQPAVPAPKEQP